MLISALCDYYDELEKDGMVLPQGYSKQNIHYLICLCEDGSIGDIVDWQERQEIPAKSGKSGQMKVSYKPRTAIMPKRTEKTAIDANVVEHRPLYIFGLDFSGGKFLANGKNIKEKHEAFCKKNLEFIDGINSPIVNAYRNFIEKWNPDDEMENEKLCNIAKSFSTSGFAFCLDGAPDVLLHNDKQLLDKWDNSFQNDSSDVIAQCAISGEVEPIAELHDKVKGLFSTGSVFIGHKTNSGCSYGKEKAYNSNVSVKCMKKYTEAMSYLLSNANHYNNIDDIHILFWAAGGQKNEICSDIFSMLSFDNQSSGLSREKTDSMLKTVIDGAVNGKAINALADISKLDNIDPTVDFYIVGIKPNTARIAVKFIYHRCFGDILLNIAQHQRDMQLGDEFKSVSVWQIKRELISPKSSKDTIDASLLSELFKSILNGTNYPNYLLSTVVRRLKTDSVSWESEKIRTGIIKACLNRKSRNNNKKEEIGMSLDKNNQNQAYLCGRLFAVLEKIQRDASGELNRTIKDAYFSSASSNPASVFPKLMRLSQTHLKKLKDSSRNYYDSIIGEIMNEIGGQFPRTLLLNDQGRFMIGYYQQKQDF